MSDREEPDSEVTDLREMRQRLKHVARGYSFAVGHNRISAAESLVRNIDVLADHEGLSGEDRYTMMAWRLLLHANRMEAMALEELMLKPMRAMAETPK